MHRIDSWEGSVEMDPLLHLKRRGKTRARTSVKDATEDWPAQGCHGDQAADLYPGETRPEGGYRFFTCGPSANVVVVGDSFDMVLDLHRTALFRRYQSNQVSHRASPSCRVKIEIDAEGLDVGGDAVAGRTARSADGNRVIGQTRGGRGPEIPRDSRRQPASTGVLARLSRGILDVLFDDPQI